MYLGHPADSVAECIIELKPANLVSWEVLSSEVEAEDWREESAV